MIVTCPNCSTGLSLDDSLIKGKQVKVRCANCRHVFPVGPVASRSASRKVADDLDLNLELPDLPDLEEGLDEALASSGGKAPAAEPDLRLDLPDLSDLESGLDDDLAAMTPKAPEPPPPPRPKAPAPPKKAAPPPLEDDSLGELGDLEDDDLATAPPEKPSKPSAMAADDDLGELPDLAGEIEDALGGPPTTSKEDDLGELGALFGEDEGPSGKADDLDLDLPGLEAEAPEDRGGTEELSLDLDLDLDMPGLGMEEEAPSRKRDDVEDEDDVRKALAAIEGSDMGDELSLDLPGAPPLDATMELSLPDLEPEEEASAPPPKGDDMDLGLDDLGDLGDLGDFEEEAPAKGAAPAGDLELSLDDLGDLGDLESGPSDVSGDELSLSLDDEPPLSPGKPSGKPDALEGGIDDLDLGDFGDLGDLEAEEPAAAAATTASSSDDLAIDLDGFELSMDAAEEAAPKPAAKPSSMDLEFDSEETMDMEPGKPGAKPAPPPPPTMEVPHPSFDAQATMAFEESFVSEDRPYQPAMEEIEETFTDEAAEEAPEERAAKPARRPRKPFPWKIVLALILAVAVLAGIAILAAKILYRPAPPPPVAVEDTFGTLHLSIAANEVEARKETNLKAGGDIIVVVGQLTNNYKEARSNLQVTAELFDDTGKAVEGATESVYCGNTPTVKDMRTLSTEEISVRLQKAAGDDNTNAVIPPGGKIGFTIVFFEPPKNVAEVSVEPLKSLPAPIKS